MKSDKYIGLDVHQATISVAVLDSAGKLMMESILETKAATILQLVQGVVRQNSNLLCNQHSKVAHIIRVQV